MFVKGYLRTQADIRKEGDPQNIANKLPMFLGDNQIRRVHFEGPEKALHPSIMLSLP